MLAYMAKESNAPSYPSGDSEGIAVHPHGVK